MRAAGIDCGTNSIRLLIADVPGSAGAALGDVVRRMEIVRLGQGVDRTGSFNPEALRRTLDVVDDYALECEHYGVEAIRFVATSATRDANNRAEFIDGVRERLGVEPQVITGEREALLSFQGAVSALDASVLHDDRRGSGEGPILTVDLGGGSTEFALGTPCGGLISSYSMNVGSVRMRERHLHSDPASAEEILAARKDVNLILDEAEQHVDLSSAHILVGLAGTVTTLTAQALKLSVYEPQKIHGTRLTVQEIDDTCTWFLEAALARRKSLGFMHPGRADVIHAGALVWQEIVKRVVERTRGSNHPITSAITSEHDILDGVTLWAAHSAMNSAK